MKRKIENSKPLAADLAGLNLASLICLTSLLRRLGQDRRGQGTTEYAILVGVLVVIAIVAVVAFRDNLQALWTSISDGINSL